MRWSIAFSSAGAGTGAADRDQGRSVGADFALAIDASPVFGLVAGHNDWDRTEDLTTPIAERCRQAAGDNSGDPLTAAMGAVEAVVAEVSGRSTGGSSVGASATLVELDDDGFRYACIGDGVLLSPEEGVFRRLSAGHGFGYQLFMEGRISFEEAYAHPNRSVLTACVLGDPPYRWDTGSGSIGPETTLVMAFDALAWDIERVQPLSEGVRVADLAERLGGLSPDASPPPNLIDVVIARAGR